MAEHTALKKALRQMAEGSRSAFHTFYMGTSQYVYNSAFLLYDSHEDACRFMVDFYQYLYLHLPEYDPAVNLNSWISRLLLERYKQLSIGKTMPEPSAKKQMASVSAHLSKSEQERVWRMLDVNIRFPKEPIRHSFWGIALLIPILLFLMLIAGRYLPDILQQFQSSGSADESENVSGDGADAADGDAKDEPDSIMDESEHPADERGESDSDGASDDGSDLQMQQSASSADAGQAGTSQEPDTPKEPEAPKEPDTPQSSQASQGNQMPDDLHMSESVDELENLELELYYGDQLRF